MKDKIIEILKKKANSTIAGKEDLCDVVDEFQFESIAEEIVKLFSESDISDSIVSRNEDVKFKVNGLEKLPKNKFRWRSYSSNNPSEIERVFDGRRLVRVDISASIESGEETKHLIDFLRVTGICFPYMIKDKSK